MPLDGAAIGDWVRSLKRSAVREAALWRDLPETSWGSAAEFSDLEGYAALRLRGSRNELHVREPPSCEDFSG